MFDLLLPMWCAGCGRVRAAVCPLCCEALAPPPLTVIEGCDAVVGAFAYRGVGRAIVGAAKYRRHRGALGFLAGQAAFAAGSALESGLIGPAMVVTWAPTTRERRRLRGFDPAEVIARSVAAGLAVAPVPMLFRTSDQAQTGHNAAQRRAGPSFAVRGRVSACVVVVDDVTTTGATLAAAAAALRAGGATKVVAVVAAVTPVGRRRVASPPVEPAGYPGTSVVYGSVVASRSQSRAKRPT